jgi:hypothetical protein
MTKKAKDQGRKIPRGPAATPQVKATTDRLVKMRQDLTELAELNQNHSLWVDERLKEMEKSPSRNLLWRISNTITLLQTVMADTRKEVGKAGPPTA